MKKSKKTPAFTITNANLDNIASTEHVSAMELALRMPNASLDKSASMEHVVLTIAIKIPNAHLDHASMEHAAMELAQKMTNAIRGIIATWILTYAHCVHGCRWLLQFLFCSL